MVHQGEALATKLDNRSSIPGTYKLGGENQLPQVLL